MVTLLSSLVFAGSLAVALLVIVLTVAASWARIIEVMGGTMPSRLPALRPAPRQAAITVRPVVVARSRRLAA